jgi:error-prone DNA polymerase
MTDDERLVSDYRGTGFTLGHHPLFYSRSYLRDLGVSPADELARIPDGTPIRTAGMVIARQRPGSASGFVFLSLEDETGISNAIIRPDLYEQNRLVVTRSKFLVIEGQLQNLDGTLSVKAASVKPLDLTAAAANSRERYANHILWMAVCGMILTVWDSTRKKIWLGGEVLYLSKQAAARV